MIRDHLGFHAYTVADGQAMAEALKDDALSYEQQGKVLEAFAADYFKRRQIEPPSTVT